MSASTLAGTLRNGMPEMPGQSTQAGFPLLSLPHELRFQIFLLVLSFLDSDIASTETLAEAVSYSSLVGGPQSLTVSFDAMCREWAPEFDGVVL